MYIFNYRVDQRSFATSMVERYTMNCYVWIRIKLHWTASTMNSAPDGRFFEFAGRYYDPPSLISAALAFWGQVTPIIWPAAVADIPRRVAYLKKISACQFTFFQVTFQIINPRVNVLFNFSLRPPFGLKFQNKMVKAECHIFPGSRRRPHRPGKSRWPAPEFFWQ